jgi:hypothetical protein
VRIAIAVGILVAVVVIYVLFLVAVHLLAKSAPPLPAMDLSQVAAEDSVVQVRLEELKTVANRLTVNVLVYPKDSLYDITPVHDPEESDPDVKDDVVITLHRSKGSLVFDLGIALILISLPTLALIVAIPMALGRTAFLPPFATWYAAMLFAIVALRNILPGSPPPGSWVDQAVVLWALIALIAAVSLYIIAWQRDRRTKKA